MSTLVRVVVVVVVVMVVVVYAPCGIYISRSRMPRGRWPPSLLYVIAKEGMGTSPRPRFFVDVSICLSYVCMYILYSYINIYIYTHIWDTCMDMLPCALRPQSSLSLCPPAHTSPLTLLRGLFAFCHTPNPSSFKFIL